MKGKQLEFKFMEGKLLAHKDDLEEAIEMARKRLKSGENNVDRDELDKIVKENQRYVAVWKGRSKCRYPNRPYGYAVS